MKYDILIQLLQSEDISVQVESLAIINNLAQEGDTDHFKLLEILDKLNITSVLLVGC